MVPVLKQKSVVKSLSPSEELSERRWVLVLSATIADVDLEKVEAIVEHLKKISQDSSITLRRVMSGTILLHLESSEGGFERIKSLFETGKLTDVLGISIEAVRLEAVTENVANVLPHTSLVSQGKGSVTMAAFDRFLMLLAIDRNEAGEKYEEIHKRLITFFSSRGIKNPEDMADETINRVITTLEIVEEGRITDIQHYSYRMARWVLLEYWNLPVIEATPDVLVQPQPSDYSGESSDVTRREECHNKCLQGLSSDKRDLLIRYYSSNKIKNRKQLANERQLSLNALRIQVHRTNYQLSECIKKCLGTS